MSNLSKPEEQKVDEQLAEFADLVLSSDEEWTMDEAVQQAEYLKLQQTVLKLKSATQHAQPDDETSARIRQKLMRKWENENKPVSPIKKFLQSLETSGLALTGGIVVVVSLLAIIFFAPSSINPGLPGAATGTLGDLWLPFVVISGIILLVIYFSLNRKR